MEETLESLEKELSDFDKAEWEMWNNDAQLTIEKLKQLESDTIPLEMAFDMDAYRGLNAKLPGLLKGQENCLNQIKKMRARLKKLRSDIDKGDGRRHKYNEFLSSEENELEILEKKFTLYQSTYDEIKTDFPVTQEKVDAIVAERMLTEEVQ